MVSYVFKLSAGRHEALTLRELIVSILIELIFFSIALLAKVN